MYKRYTHHKQLNQNRQNYTAFQPHMGLSAAQLSQHGPISSATQPKKDLSAALLSLTWAYQHSLTA